MNIKCALFLLLIVAAIFNCQASGTTVDETQKLEQWFKAALEDRIEIIQKLIDKVDINAQDKEGTTALIIAARWGHEDLVKFLLQAPNINVNKQDEKGNTALIMGALHGHENTTKLLCKCRILTLMLKMNAAIPP